MNKTTMEMSDLESHTNHSGKQNSGKNASGWKIKHVLFVINFIIIAGLNFAQFVLTSYGRHKLDTDSFHGDYFYSNWDALKFCLAVACLTWIFITYAILRRTHDGWFDFFYSVKGWDIVIANFIIWALQLSAAAAQTAFLNDYYHCKMYCVELNEGSIQRNTAYAVLAWMLTTAWTPQLIYSLWDSKDNN